MSRHPKPLNKEDYDEYSSEDLEQEEKLIRKRRSEQTKTDKPVKTPRKNKKSKHGNKA